MTEIPEWLGGAIVGVIVTTLSFMGKEMYNIVKNRYQRKQIAVQELETLLGLLDESFSIFVSQNNQRNRLMTLLNERHQPNVPQALGFDETFFQMHDQMDQEELELFKIIRGLTAHSMLPVNERLQQWAKDNTARQLVRKNRALAKELDEQLGILRTHLSHWFAKYNSVFKDDEKRSLVYLDDEKHQGIGFPKQLRSVVEKVLNDLD